MRKMASLVADISSSVSVSAVDIIELIFSTPGYNVSVGIINLILDALICRLADGKVSGSLYF
jgi:hypothetical protein